MSRRAAAQIAFGAALSAGALWLAFGPLPLLGEMRRFMFEEGISGAVVVMVREGQITRSLALGNHSSPTIADEPVSTELRFPIASLSKPVTAATVQRLIAARQVGLDDRLVDLLPDLSYHDSQYAAITVRQLLQHTAGFDRTISGDPLFGPGGSVLGCDQAIEKTVRRPLDFSPGGKARYSNVGYCLLGLIVSRVTGLKYEVAVRELLSDVFDTSNLTLGPPDERVEQLWLSNVHFSRSVWRRLEAPGGWFSDAATLATFVAADARRPGIDTPPASFTNGDYYYGLGWRVWPTRGEHYLTHFGALPGMFSFAIAYPDGRAAVALFNARPSNDEAAALRLAAILGERLKHDSRSSLSQ